MSDVEKIGWIATLWDRIKNSAFLIMTAWCGCVLWGITKLVQYTASYFDKVVVFPVNYEEWLNVYVLFSVSYFFVYIGCKLWINIRKKIDEREAEIYERQVESELDKILSDTEKYEEWFEIISAYFDKDFVSFRVSDKYIVDLVEKGILTRTNRFEMGESVDVICEFLCLSDVARIYMAKKELEAEMEIRME